MLVQDFMESHDEWWPFVGVEGLMDPTEDVQTPSKTPPGKKEKKRKNKNKENHLEPSQKVRGYNKD